MVFFTCNNCGSALKKNKVEKHYITECRSSPSLSCMDCMKDFFGDQYKSHTKCMTEDQKYSGKPVDSNISLGKGEKKQLMWVETVRQIIDDKGSALTPQERQLLENMKDFENIPRKKKKFENFVRNVMKRHIEQRTVDRVWSLLEGQKSASGDKLTNGCKSDHLEERDNEKNEEVEKSMMNSNGGGNEESSKEKKKKKKKNKKLNEGGDDANDDNEGVIEGEVEKDKKRKKKKNRDEGHLKDVLVESNKLKSSGEGRKRKLEEADEREESCKRKTIEKEAVEEFDSQGNGDATEEQKSQKKGKFKWNKTIISVLQVTPENELSVKRLRKKVLAEYEEWVASGESSKSTFTDALGTFERKLHKTPGVRILKDRAKLVATSS